MSPLLSGKFRKEFIYVKMYQSSAVRIKKNGTGLGTGLSA
jgi:hypothetical protein